MRLRHRQWVAAVIVIGGAGLAAYKEWWPFDSNVTPSEEYEDPSISQIVLGDRLTLGLVRLAILALAGFVLVSVPALILAGRWLKGFGTQSLAADTAEDATQTIEEWERKLRAAQEELGRVKGERDTALAIAQSLADKPLSSARKQSGRPLAPD